MRITRANLRRLILEQLEPEIDYGEIDDELVKFIVRSNKIEGYEVDPEDVRSAIEGVEAGYPIRYVTNNPHIAAHLLGIEAAKSGNAQSLDGAKSVHKSMGPDVLDSGVPGVTRMGTEAESAGGTKYVPSKSVGDAMTWWENTKFPSPFERHTVYELIHPFADGNGRSGRILLAADLGFNFKEVNKLIGDDYFSNLSSFNKKYQGEFWN